MYLQKQQQQQKTAETHIATRFWQSSFMTENEIYAMSWLFTNLLYWNKTKTVIRMMTSSNGNIFRVTGPLWGGFTGHRWIPYIKASDAELWCFLWSAPE